MISRAELNEMFDEVDLSSPGRPSEIAQTLINELRDVGEMLIDLQGEKRCFCSMPVHLNACQRALDWKDALTE